MIHSLRFYRTRRRRGCSSCGTWIGKGEGYWSRNSSLMSRGGVRVYGFFSTHTGCEELVTELGLGLGECEDGRMTYPGWLSHSLVGRKPSQIPGWSKFSVEDRRRFLKLMKGPKKTCKRTEYRICDEGTGERVSFMATLGQVDRYLKKGGDDGDQEKEVR